MTKPTTKTTVPLTEMGGSIYQQLRGHLTNLKLTAAAEALPQVIEQATAEKLSLTAALERLLAIEVTTAEARRLTGRLRFACLPSPATLEDFDYDAQPGVDHKLINELGTCAYLHNATNVLLIGPPGVGKRISRSVSHAKPRTWAIGLTSRPQQNSPHAATVPRSKDDGQQQCGSLTARHCL